MKPQIKFTLPLLFSVAVMIGACKHEPMVVPARSSDATNAGHTNGNNTNNNDGNSGNTVVCAPDTAYFQNDILPLFVSNCAMTACHDAQTHQTGIVLDSYNNIIATGNVRAFDVNHGKIYESLTTGDIGDRMPPSPRPSLTPDKINLITKWINQGALNNVCNAGGGACDTTHVTYAGIVAPLLQAHCTGCHNSASPGGNINLTSYAGVQPVALNGHLLGSVNHDAGFSAMPKNITKLADCQISQIRIWIQNGSLND